MMFAVSQLFASTPLLFHLIERKFVQGESWAPTTTLPETAETGEIEDFEKCRDGKRAIGECVAELCPGGYTCEENLCCSE
ncbi:hypothetical protein KIN20_008690 [Parelaphostrongylus tenuis]|uniref:Uncharacterized protein n=1 Tax=Parelaphostrongylus tenuis TaxID=148309 RepID=A0AAD5M548_PARTN|nr:hypothetical protein KIN20_008690 [Parelaphostrongylus tenuis]